MYEHTMQQYIPPPKNACAHGLIYRTNTSTIDVKMGGANQHIRIITMGLT